MLVYDRAGLGRSDPTEPPYRIDDEAEALRRELNRHAIVARVVLVAHSYADFVAASPEREAGTAEGSSRHVMHDRPDVVLEAVSRIVAMVRARLGPTRT
jgi:hypothetical protein